MSKTNWSLFKVIPKNTLVLIFLLLLIMVIVFTYTILFYKIPLNTNFISIFAFAISGLTFVFSFIIPLFKEPKLRTEIEGKPVFSRTRDENPSSWFHENPSSWFHRLLIINDGFKPAENCVGKLIEIRDKKGQTITKFDPLPIYWTHQNKNTGFRPVSIFGRGDYAILDILQEKEVIHNDELSLFNEMADYDRDQYPHSISEAFISATEDKLPEIRVHLPDPEKLPYNEIHSASPGNCPILIPGIYYLSIGVYADNGMAKPEWYKLDITLSSRQEIVSVKNPESKVKLEKVKEKAVPRKI